MIRLPLPRRSRLRLPAALALLFALPAAGHDVRPALLHVTEVLPQRFEVVWKEPVLGARRLPLRVELPGECEEHGAVLPEHTGDALIERRQVDCSLRSGTIVIHGLAATLTDALVRIDYRDGESLHRMLRGADAVLDLSDPAPGAGAYFLLGVEHLLLGIDHILFVVGLVLFIRAPWMLLKAVTAFTVAHSITLALSVLELVRLPQGPVEAVIALSILFLARELMVPMHLRSPLTRAAPWLMAFAFGLLHGFGFAGVLADIGLPRDQLALALLLFNLGIEAGQIGIIVVLLAGLRLLAKPPALRNAGRLLTSASSRSARSQSARSSSSGRSRPRWAASLASGPSTACSRSGEREPRGGHSGNVDLDLVREVALVPLLVDRRHRNEVPAR